MARGTQHRKRRTGANARNAQPAAAVAAPRKERPPQWQEELFFQRLRVHAKWAFVLLALVFGLGFVFLGIGSGSNGVTDALENAFNVGKGGGASISSLEKKTEKDSLNAQAWRDLATAYETKRRTADAVRALSQYTALRPKDAGALAELASEYSQQARDYATDYQNAQQEIANQTLPLAFYAPPATSPFGKALADPKALQDPIASSVQTLTSTRQTTAYSNYQGAQRNAEQTYQKLAQVTPNDANTQLQLAQAAQAAQDSPVALAAFEKFLKLAPNDPLSPQVAQQVKLLRAQTKIQSAVGTGKPASK